MRYNVMRTILTLLYVHYREVAIYMKNDTKVNKRHLSDSRAVD